jgi:hypothetical protein
MGKSGNTAATREMVANEGHTLERSHFTDSGRLLRSPCLETSTAALHSSLPSSRCLFDGLQQVWSLTAARIRQEARQTVRTHVNVGAVRLHKNGVADGKVEGSGPGTASDNEKPSLWFHSQPPGRIGR